MSNQILTDDDIQGLAACHDLFLEGMDEYEVCPITLDLFQDLMLTIMDQHERLGEL